MNRPDHTAEAEIAPLVDALNSLPGAQILGFSHGWNFQWLAGWQTPYVYFQAPAALAQQLSEFLFQDQQKSSPHLRLHWNLKGLFHPVLGMCYHLEAPSLPISSRLLRMDRLQRNLRADCLTLAGLLRMHEAPPSHVAQVSNEPKRKENDEEALHLSVFSGVGVATQGADISMAADRPPALLAIDHGHPASPSCDVVTPESLSDLLVRVIHQNAAVHDEKAHSRDIVANALALTFVRLVGTRGALGFIQPRDFASWPTRHEGQP